MPSIMDLVQEHLGDSGVTQLTQHLGVDPSTAQAAAAAALPVLVNAISSRTSPAGPANIPGTGAGGLGGAAGGLLGNLFGGNHAQVTQQVSKHSGLDIHQAEKALLFLAPIVMAQLQRRQQAAGAGAAAAQAPSSAGPSGAPPSPGQPSQPAPQPESGLGGVIGAVEKMLHRKQ